MTGTVIFFPSGTTSLDARFNVAFSLAKPPLISRLYAQLPGFPGPRKETPLAMLAAHSHLALLRVATTVSGGYTRQDFFIYDASASNPSELQRLPPCTEPAIDYICGGGRIPRRRPAEDGASAERRLLAVRSMGLFSRGEGGEQDGFAFAVAELNLFKLSRTEVYADICFFKSGDQIGGEWTSVRVPIHHGGVADDLWQLCLWQTDAVVPADRWLCWVDYYRGTQTDTIAIEGYTYVA